MGKRGKGKSKGGGGASSGGKSVPKPPKPKDPPIPATSSGNSGKRKSKSRPFYQVLGLNRGASMEDVRKEYNRMMFLAKKYKVSTKTIEMAIYTLGHEGRRALYDLHGPEESDEHNADSHDEALAVELVKKYISLSLGGEASDTAMRTNEIDYRGSDLEIYEICGLYRKHKGDMERILLLLPFYDRGANWYYKNIIDESISSGKLGMTHDYKVWASDVVENQPQDSPFVGWNSERQKVLKCNKQVELGIMGKALDGYSLEPFSCIWSGTLNSYGFQDRLCHVILLHRSAITDDYVDALVKCAGMNVLKVIHQSVIGSVVALACEPLYCSFSSYITKWNVKLTTVRRLGFIVDYIDKVIKLMRKILKSVHMIHLKGKFLTRLHWTEDIYMTHDGDVRLSLTGLLAGPSSSGSVAGDIVLVAKVFDNMINACFPNEGNLDKIYWTQEMRQMVQLMNDNYYKTPLECLRNPVVMYSSKKVSALRRFGDSTMRYVEKDIPGCTFPNATLWRSSFRQAILYLPSGPRDYYLNKSTDESDKYGGRRSIRCNRKDD